MTLLVKDIVVRNISNHFFSWCTLSLLGLSETLGCYWQEALWDSWFYDYHDYHDWKAMGMVRIEVVLATLAHSLQQTHDTIWTWHIQKGNLEIHNRVVIARKAAIQKLNDSTWRSSRSTEISARERNVLWCLRCCCTITRVSSGFLWSGVAVSFTDAWPKHGSSGIFWDFDTTNINE